MSFVHQKMYSTYDANAKDLTVFTHLYAETGERIHASKFSKLFGIEDLVDIPSFLADEIGEKLEKYVEINMALAKEGYSPLCVKKAFKKKVVTLTWCTELAALFACGVHPDIAKLYVFHPNEQIYPALYESLPLLITESLLGNERGAAFGLERILYFPHHFSHIKKRGRSDAIRQKVSDKKVVIGCVSRLEYWKNVEFALEAVRALSAKFPDVVLYLKGNFPKQEIYPTYYEHLRKKLALYIKEPWLIWDNSATPYPEILDLYASFDFCLQPSGSEGGSNVVVELLALGVPTIVLDVSTNPYLFKGAATFAKATAVPNMTQLYFYEPDLDSLIEQCERLMDEKERNRLSTIAQEVAFSRFHPSIAIKRFKIMMDPNLGKKELQKLYDQDRTLYRL